MSYHMNHSLQLADQLSIIFLYYQFWKALNHVHIYRSNSISYYLKLEFHPYYNLQAIILLLLLELFLWKRWVVIAMSKGAISNICPNLHTKVHRSVKFVHKNWCMKSIVAEIKHYGCIFERTHPFHLARACVAEIVRSAVFGAAFPLNSES